MEEQVINKEMENNKGTETNISEETKDISQNVLLPKLLDKNDAAYKSVEELNKVITLAMKEKRVRNIALTGPYGSGKSSILQTFIRDYKKEKKESFWGRIIGKKKYKILNISLATLQSEDSNQHNLLSQNKIDNTTEYENIILGGHRKCILVTNNENNICEEVTYERNRRVIQGYTNAKGEEVPGLIKNSLRYYRTGFVGRSRSMQNMRKLVNLATDMLCIKEDLYTEQTTFGEQKTHKGVFRYFDDGNKKMLIIYREEVIDELVDIIYDMDVDQPIKVYVFSPSEDPWEGSFEDVSDKVELCALPQAIYNTYRRILPKKKDAVVMPEDDALATTEKEEEQFNGMLNFEYDEEA